MDAGLVVVEYEEGDEVGSEERKFGEYLIFGFGYLDLGCDLSVI